MEQLLTFLIKILIENAGAQTGFLILANAGEWLIEASGEFNARENDYATQILQSLTTANHLPESIINYVIRTDESVILNNAMIKQINSRPRLLNRFNGSAKRSGSITVCN